MFEGGINENMSSKGEACKCPKMFKLAFFDFSMGKIILEKTMVQKIGVC